MRVGRLLWIVENFFRQFGREAHEIGLVFQMAFPAGSPWLDTTRAFNGHEPTVELIFRWFPLAHLAAVPLHPTLLHHALRRLPDQPVHLVHRDPGEH